MNRPLILIGLSSLLATSSCEKHQSLLNERSSIEVQINQGQEELKALDAKFATLGTDFVTAMVVFERQHADWQKKNSVLETEIALLSKKCTEGEAGLKILRPKVDSYKSKFFR